jgi:hypothetical protein
LNKIHGSRGSIAGHRRYPSGKYARPGGLAMIRTPKTLENHGKNFDLVD